MATIERNRKLRPSTRQASSSYKIDCSKVTAADTLIINITHEEPSEDVNYTYQVDGKEVANKNSLHFSAKKVGDKWLISWTGNVIPRLKG